MENSKEKDKKEECFVILKKFHEYICRAVMPELDANSSYRWKTRLEELNSFLEMEDLIKRGLELFGNLLQEKTLTLNIKSFCY